MLVFSFVDADINATVATDFNAISSPKYHPSQFLLTTILFQRSKSARLARLQSILMNS
jgi:hypothetical protein